MEESRLGKPTKWEQPYSLTMKWLRLLEVQGQDVGMQYTSRLSTHTHTPTYRESLLSSSDISSLHRLSTISLKRQQTHTPQYGGQWCNTLSSQTNASKFYWVLSPCPKLLTSLNSTSYTHCTVLPIVFVPKPFAQERF